MIRAMARSRWLAAASLAAAVSFECGQPTPPGPAASQIVFATAPQTLRQKRCSAAVTIQTTDVAGNAISVSADALVSLSSSSATMSFFSDSACSSPVLQVVVHSGSSATSFYFSDPTAGAPSISASAPGLGSTMQAETIAAGAAKVAFASAPQTIDEAVCSAPIQAQLQDPSGRPTSSDAALSLSPVSSSATSSFFSDAACTVGETALAVATGSSGATFYMMDSTPGTITVTISAPGLAGDTQVEIIKAVAAWLAFTTPSQSIPEGVCSATASIQIQDRLGHPVSVGVATPVSLTTTSQTGRFFSDPACSMGVSQLEVLAGSSAVAFYFNDSTPGTPMLTAASTELASAKQTETVTAVASVLAFSTGAQTLPVGTCSAPITIQLRDAGGRPVPVGSATAVLLSSSSATGTFSLSGTCIGTATSVSIPVGSATATFYFEDTAPGSPMLTAMIPSMGSGSQIESITDVPTALTFTNTPLKVPEDSCSPALTLQIEDARGLPVTKHSAISVSLTSTSGTTAFFADPACSVPSPVLSVAVGASGASFYVKDPIPGPPTLTATASGLASASQNETIVAVSAWLAFTSPPLSVPEGSCSAVVTVQDQDQAGRPVDAAAPMSIFLSSTSATTLFYSDASCVNPVSSVMLAVGSSQIGFYFGDSTPGAPTLTVAASGLGSGTQTETVSAVPTQLAFVTPPQTIAEGACSAAALVQIEDSAGRPVAATSTTTLTLSSSPPTGAFYADSACTVLTTTLTIQAGSEGSFYFSDTVAGTPTLTVSGTGLTSAVQKEDVTPQGSNLVFLSTAQKVNAGACSATATVAIEDSNGVPSPVSMTTIGSLTSNSMTMSFFLDAVCASATSSLTIPAGSSTTQFYFKDATLGAPTITVSIPGLTKATQTETIQRGPPAVLSFMNGSETVAAGACSGAATLQTEDLGGNPSPIASALVVSLATTSSAGTFYSDSACTTAVTTVSVAASASSATFYFKDTKAGSPTLTASATGFTSATQIETITPMAPITLVFATPAQTIPAGTCSAGVVVLTTDTYGNTAPVTASTTLTYVSNPANSVYSDANCTVHTNNATIASGGSQATLYFENAKAGALKILASATGLTHALQSETILAGPPSQIAFATSPQTLTWGTCSGVVTVRVEDMTGNAVTVTPAAVVALSSTSTRNTFYGDSACTQATTSTTISSTASFYFRDNAVGTPTLTAAASFGTGTQIETIAAQPASILAFSSSAQTLTARACSGLIVLQSEDGGGNPSNVGSDTPVALSSTSAGGLFYSDSNCTVGVISVTISAGTNSAGLFYRDTSPGTPTLDGSAPPFTDATQVETIQASGPMRLAFTSAPETETAGTCSGAVAIQTQDAGGNAFSVPTSIVVRLASTSGTLAFYTDAACSTVATNLVLATGASSANFYFKDTKVGGPIVTVSAGGLWSAQQTEVVAPGTPSALAFTAGPLDLNAGACGGLGVQLRDTNGNATPPTSATPVSLSSTSSGNHFYVDAKCSVVATTVTIPSGSNGANFFFSDTQVGSPTISASVSSLAPATQVEQIYATPVTSNPAFVSAAQTLTAGACSSAVTVQMQDSSGNQVNVSSATTVTLSSSSGGLYADSACKMSVTSVTVPAGSSSASFYFEATQRGTATISASYGVSSATQTETVGSGAPTQLYLSLAYVTTINTCAPATVVMRDAFNNLATESSATTITVSGTVATVFYLDNTCTTTTSTTSIPAGASEGAFYFENSTAGGPITLTASATGLGSGTAVTYANTYQLAFTTSPQTLTAGACSGIITIQAQDASGNPVDVGGSGLNVAIYASPDNVYLDANCTTLAGSGGYWVTIPAGASTTSFYLKFATAGSQVVTTDSDSFGVYGYSNASQTETVLPASAAALAFATSAQTVTAGQCSGVTTVQVRDSAGNPTMVSGVTPVNLATSPSGGTFYSDAACTSPITILSIASGGNNVSFYFKNTTAGSPALQASASGLAPATQTQTVNPAPPVGLMFVSAAQTLLAGACSTPLTVSGADAYGNSTSAGVPISITSNSVSATFYAEAACAMSLGGTLNTASNYGPGTGNFFSDTRGGAVTLTASAPGFPSASQIETIVGTDVLFVTPSQTAAAVGSTVTASVAVQGMESFDSFEVYLSYGSAGVLQSPTIDTSGMLLPAAAIAAQCIDGAGTGCTSSDGLGVVHLKASGSASGNAATGILFAITFQVTGVGTTALHTFSTSFWSGGASVGVTSLDGSFLNQSVITIVPSPTTGSNGSSLAVSVTLLNLGVSTAIDCIGASVQYGNGVSGPLRPASLDDTQQGIFQGTPVVLASCIDGSGTKCGSYDQPGVVTMVLLAPLGTESIPPPSSIAFQIHFNVVGSGQAPLRVSFPQVCTGSAGNPPVVYGVGGSFAN
jgi:hypothetical protein